MELNIGRWRTNIGNDDGHRGIPTKIRFVVRQITRWIVSWMGTVIHSACCMNYSLFVWDFATYHARVLGSNHPWPWQVLREPPRSHCQYSALIWNELCPCGSSRLHSICLSCILAASPRNTHWAWALSLKHYRKHTSLIGSVIDRTLSGALLISSISWDPVAKTIHLRNWAILNRPGFIWR